MAIVIFLIIGFLSGALIGPYLNRDYSTEKRNKEVQHASFFTDKECEKIFQFAINQLKDGNKDLSVSTFDAANEYNLVEHSWKFWSFLEDCTLTIYVNGPFRWKTDTVQSLLKNCIEHYVATDDNPFTAIEVELRTGDEPIQTTDLCSIEPFLDIIYKHYFNHTFLSMAQQHKDELNLQNKQDNLYRKHLYKKIGINKNGDERATLS